MGLYGIGQHLSRDFVSIDIDSPRGESLVGAKFFFLSMERCPVKWNNDVYIYIYIYTSPILIQEFRYEEDRKNLFEFRRKETVRNSDRFRNVSIQKKKKRKEETRNQFLKITGEEKITGMEEP